MSEKINCLIIGSGPAGYTAAIYAARANMNPVLYQGIQPGGQLTTTTDVENFPGYPDGISGPDMMIELQKQAERFGTDIRNGWITKVDFSNQLKLWVNDEHELECKTVIISTGASAKYLGLESEKKYLESGGGVSACAVCDGFFYKNQEVVIVGGGDSACEEAHYLSKLCSKVTMLVRRDEFRASKIMQERVKKTENIEILFNSGEVFEKTTANVAISTGDVIGVVGNYGTGKNAYATLGEDNTGIQTITINNEEATIRRLAVQSALPLEYDNRSVIFQQSWQMLKNSLAGRTGEGREPRLAKRARRAK